ncbi:hypothetical protein V493_03683 [Pseudogymnoascus sp. VKM F-4281 (FW-2241)]|nr:hypothetical protein V493_03683 [Pseudogymnoascus sp. VKM F-4281 (FW-2241)]
MFGRRKRAASNPHANLNVNADPSATTAAAQAFLARSKSNATLSAAAAAAALRSRPTSPTNVAEVQTKRTMRRENSGSSRGSSVPARSSSQLERRRSSSSMSERTFRDPSPARGAARPSAPDAPPVPTIPESLIERASPTPVRRPSSVQPAPTRVSSPPVNPGTGRGASLQPTMRTPAQTRSGPRVTSMSNIQELTSLDRPSSRGSVNFSLPTSLRRSSSAAQWMLTPRQSSQALNGNELVFDPNTRTLRTRADMLFYEQGLREASQKPVMRKKSLRQGQGSHFSEGSVGGRLKGTALDSAHRQNVHERQATNGVLSEEYPRSQRVASPRNSIRDSSDNESEASERTSKYNNRAGPQQLSNKPSMVREERQREEDEDDSVKVLGRQAALRKLESANRNDRHISPSPLPRSKSGKARKQAENIGSYVEQDQTRTEATAAPATQAETAPPQISPPVKIPAPAQETASKAEAPAALAPLDTATSATKVPRMEKQAVDRSHSLSPTHAHFLTTPSPVSQFSIRHEPPARSLSPRKSALKPSPSPRGPSPMGYNPTGWTAGPSSGDVSDASTNQSEDRIVPKKKSVRVSFDERSNVVVGEEPEVPEARRAWTSGYIRGNKATSPIEDGPDETMGPRPILPSFGSVRKKEPRDFEDRPLVKPVGLQGPSPAISPSNSGSDYFAGQSSDHAVGSLLNQERNLRAAPSVSNSNDPLPPEVTSVEGSGYVSDSGSSTHSFVVGKAVAVPLAEKNEDAQQTVEASGKPSLVEDLGVIPEVETPGDDVVREQLEEFPAESREDDAAAHDSKINGNGNGPTLTLTQPTPLPEQMEFQPQIPGGLNGNTWEPANAKEIPLKDYIAGNEVAGGSVAVQNNLDDRPVTADTDSSDGDSIYSDAAEEISDGGDGFMSLDAVLGGMEPSGKATEPPKVPDSGEGWDESQRFWSGLSADKRRQMELDALLENDEEREDSEDEVPDLKPLKQASVTKAQTTPKEKQQVKKAATGGAPGRTYQITPGAKAGPDGAPSMRTSLRAPKPRQEEGHMRMSMRDNAGGSMRSNASGRPREGKKLQAGGAAAAMKMNAPKPTPTPKPTLRRSASVESDSSFVRERPRKDGVQMKRSMRGSSSREAPTLRGPGPIGPTPAQSSRFSIRSLSPSSRRPSVSSTTRPTPSLRSAPDEPPKSPRRLFSRSKAAPAPKAYKPSSRFVDSSDEEDARPARTFRSRFADSSDEEDGPPPPPVTGSFRSPQSLKPVPRSNAADGDSSDLPDSDDSSPFRGASGVNAAALRMARANFQSGGNVTEISAADFREAPRKKGGLMSILRRKKPEQSGRIQRMDWGESAARRDTPLERSKTDLEVVKSRDASVGAKAAQSPRLQKRAGPSRTASWQGAPAVEPQDDERPATSDGVADGWKADSEGAGVNGAAASRPGVLRRNNTVGSVEIVGAEGKKKKFGRLRRLFGN